MSTRRRPIKRLMARWRTHPGFAEAEIAVYAWLAWAVLRLLRATTRFEVVGAERLEEQWNAGRPMVFAFWHGRSIMLPFLVRGRRDAYIMNSTHRDGEIITRALERFGIRSTRGSSTRGAVAGTLALLRALKRGSSVALIPDGPRGPAGVAKAGAVELASSGGAPLFPLSFSASRAIRLGGWDRMMLPAPGARVVCVVGEALEVGDGGRGREAREKLRAALEARLEEVTRRADRLGRAARGADVSGARVGRGRALALYTAVTAGVHGVVAAGSALRRRGTLRPTALDERLGRYPADSAATRRALDDLGPCGVGRGGESGRAARVGARRARRRRRARRAHLPDRDGARARSQPRSLRSPFRAARQQARGRWRARALSTRALPARRDRDLAGAARCPRRVRRFPPRW